MGGCTLVGCHYLWGQCFNPHLLYSCTHGEVSLFKAVNSKLFMVCASGMKIKIQKSFRTEVFAE